MRLLIVSATVFEIAPLLRFLEEGSYRQVQPFHFRKGTHDLRLLVTGVGIALTAYHLAKALGSQPFDLVINAGIAGSFNRSIHLGEVVQVVSEEFGELGVEEADGSFSSVFSMGLLEPDHPPFEKGRLIQPNRDPIPGMRAVAGLTTDRVHGFPPGIEACVKRYGADIETMESAAFFLCCLLEKRPFFALRAVSNYVEARNKEAWELPKAIDRLNETLISITETILEGSVR